MKRWLTLTEVAEVIAKSNPRVEKLSRKRRRERALRSVRRVEEIRGEKLSRKVRGQWFVSAAAADELHKWDPDSLHQLGRAVADLHHQTNEDRKRLNAHGAKLREHARRLGIVEEKQTLAETYLSGLARIDGRTDAA